MSSSIPEPTYNGLEVSWTDLITSIVVNNQVTHLPVDYAAISLESTRETVQTFARGYPRKSTSGKVAHTGSMQYWTSGMDAVLETMVPIAQQLGFVVGNTVRVGLVPLTITLKFFPPGSNKLWERTIVGARFTKLALGATEGADPQVEDVDLGSISDIKWRIGGVEVGI